MTAGSRLRRIREGLGLTYRDVQRASIALARNRGRQEFVVHISRLAEIENRQVVPSLHKLYTLAAIYRLSPAEMFCWYGIPLSQLLPDAISLPVPATHLMNFPETEGAEPDLTILDRPEETAMVKEALLEHGGLRNALRMGEGSRRYGCIGTRDHRMEPILRPGSVVLIDTTVRRVEETEWASEFDRPLYFVELHEGYRCGWFIRDGSRLVMETHPLSRCAPEWWKTPDDAEVVGRVTAVVSQLPVPGKVRSQESRESRERWSKTAP